MSTLADFLLARIAEDEADARAASPAPWHYAADNYTQGNLWWGDSSSNGIAHASWEHREEQTERDLSHIARHDPARVLAECEAKRRIVEMFTPPHASTYERLGAGLGLRLLALPYADHEDFDESWRP